MIPGEPCTTPAPCLLTGPVPVAVWTLGFSGLDLSFDFFVLELTAPADCSFDLKEGELSLGPTTSYVCSLLVDLKLIYSSRGSFFKILSISAWVRDWAEAEYSLLPLNFP